MVISRYGEPDRQSVQVAKDLAGSIADKHVILVEDIVNSGITLKFCWVIFRKRSRLRSW